MSNSVSTLMHTLRTGQTGGKLQGAIIDCDGTLALTELPNLMAFRDILAEEYDIQLTVEEIYDAHVGKDPATIFIDSVRDTGTEIDTNILPNLVARFEKQAIEYYGEHADAVEGAAEMMRILTVKAGQDLVAVGSNGAFSCVEASLKSIGIHPMLKEGHIFTADRMPKGLKPKPSPDLFIYAAQQMGITADNYKDVLVVEDSRGGATAALSAGMCVVGYTGSNPNPEAARRMFEELGVELIINDLADLNAVLKNVGRPGKTKAQSTPPVRTQDITNIAGQPWSLTREY